MTAVIVCGCEKGDRSRAECEGLKELWEDFWGDGYAYYLNWGNGFVMHIHVLKLAKLYMLNMYSLLIYVSYKAVKPLTYSIPFDI